MTDISQFQVKQASFLGNKLTGFHFFSIITTEFYGTHGTLIEN